MTTMSREYLGTYREGTPTYILYNGPYKSLDNKKIILPPSTVPSRKYEGTRPFMEGREI